MQAEVGRPLPVFGWHPVRLDNLLHEVRVTQAWLAITRGREHAALRLSEVHKRLKPDMELTIIEQGEHGPEKDHYYVEMDCGTVSHKAQMKRWDLYVSLSAKDCEVLVITTSQVRLQGLMMHAEAIDHLALFTTLDALLEDPAGEVWTNRKGERQRI